MSNTKNIFVSHYHSDAEKIEQLNALLNRHGLKMKDGSIYENKNPNNAHNEEYIELNNGLSTEENEILFNTVFVDEAVQLILKGLQTI